MPRRRIGNMPEPARTGIVGLVGMEVEIEPMVDGRAEHTVEQCVKIRHHIRDCTEHAAGSRHPADKRFEPVRLAHTLDPQKACRLQRDPSFPALAHRLEHRP